VNKLGVGPEILEQTGKTKNQSVGLLWV